MILWSKAGDSVAVNISECPVIYHNGEYIKGKSIHYLLLTKVDPTRKRFVDLVTLDEFIIDDIRTYKDVFIIPLN